MQFEKIAFKSGSFSLPIHAYFFVMKRIEQLSVLHVFAQLVSIITSLVIYFLTDAYSSNY